MNFDLDQLRMFDALMRLRNFRSAARSVGAAQSTLSQRIARLEAQFGRPLFARPTRRVEPTAHARALHPHARTLLAYVADVHGMLARLGEVEAACIAAPACCSPHDHVEAAQPATAVLSACPGGTGRDRACPYADELGWHEMSAPRRPNR